MILDRGRCLAEVLEVLRDLEEVRAGLGSGLQLTPDADERAAAILREHGVDAEVRGLR